MNLLVDEGILYKKRGIGMFVAAGTRERLARKRRQQFSHEYGRPLIEEAAKLGITESELSEMIRKETEG